MVSVQNKSEPNENKDDGQEWADNPLVAFDMHAMD